MSTLSAQLQKAMDNALLEEIMLFRESGKASELNEETFDPTKVRTCFLGQTGQQDTSVFSVDSEYRNKIGIVPVGLGLKTPEGGSYLDNGTMTALEIWAAANWIPCRDKVIEVLRYIKGKSDVIPEVTYASPTRQLAIA